MEETADMMDGGVRLFQTEADIAQMEPFQRDKVTLEGQNQVEQRYLEMLAYAM